ncbi:MAG: hypothetical protein ABSG43_06110, partial [Solirubrobacteraceae bacterium]
MRVSASVRTFSAKVETRSIRWLMPATTSLICSNASRVFSTVEDPCSVRLAPSCTTPTALGLGLDSGDQRADFLGGVLEFLG